MILLLATTYLRYQCHFIFIILAFWSWGEIQEILFKITQLLKENITAVGTRFLGMDCFLVAVIAPNLALHHILTFCLISGVLWIPFCLILLIWLVHNKKLLICGLIDSHIHKLLTWGCHLKMIFWLTFLSTLKERYQTISNGPGLSQRRRSKTLRRVSV